MNTGNSDEADFEFQFPYWAQWYVQCSVCFSPDDGNMGLNMVLQGFGDPRWKTWVLDEEQSLPILKAAYDRGLNTWDTGL